MEANKFAVFYNDEYTQKLMEYDTFDNLKEAIEGASSFSDDTKVWIYKMAKEGTCKSVVEWK